jgi:acyl-CoA synthetase (AMP-forming)/AMP-acid ligase II
MNLVELLRDQAAQHPDAAAIIDVFRGKSRATTFAELELTSQRAATLLGEVGLKPGDAVLIFHPMSAELYVALLAMFRVGLVAMFLDPSAGKEHIERCCEIHPPRALLAGAKAHLLRLSSPALRRIPKKFSIGLPLPRAVSWSRLQRLPPKKEVHSAEPTSPALLTFTSGSTGRPKAALRTHDFLLAQHRVLQKNLNLVAGEVDLTTLPIFLLANLASGVTSVIPNADLRFPGNVDPAPIAEQIAMHRPTRTAASPAFLERLANCTNRPGLGTYVHPLSDFEKIYTGGAPVFPKVLRTLKQAAPQAEVTAVYGSTEAEPIAHIEVQQVGREEISAMLNGRGLLAGWPVREIQLKVMPDQWGKPIGSLTRAEFENMCLWAGEPGEIVVSGEHVLKGYLNGHGDEESKFNVSGQRWHRTGDAGYLDSRGWLWLLGRCSARINDSHGTLYPFTTECIANHYTGVRRSAMISHKGRRLLVVEPLEGWNSIGGQFSGLEASLAWAHIDEVRAFQKLPMDKRHNAKIDYPALQAMLEKELR